MEQFEKLLGKESHLLDSIKDRGFEIPSEIQDKTIPMIIEGMDVIASASTGSGKTLAFAAGLIKNVIKDKGIQGLVMTPTRELAEQITKELSDFSKYKELRIECIYGGVSIIEQIRNLQYADIVVGTPGRILDHIGRNTIDLSRVNTLVLDEADRMLDMGFIEDVDDIIKECPKERQTLLFSATISPDISILAKKYLRNPVEVSAEQYVDPKKLEQVFYDVDDYMKFSLLKHLLMNENSKLVMIFCNTRKNVDFVANNLMRSGVDALPIHGGYSQSKRNNILQDFHSNKTCVLVATDVAARGLDIKGVTHIYNYDIPMNAKEYTHRIGRTARAGKEGKVINILSSRDYDNFREVMKEEFIIKRIETPEIQIERLKWFPNENQRFSRREDSGSGNFRGREKRGRDDRGRGSSDSRGRFGNRNKRDNRSFSRR